MLLEGATPHQAGPDRHRHRAWRRVLSALPLLSSALAAVEVASAVWAVVFVAFGLMATVATLRFAVRRGAARLCSWQEVDRTLTRMWHRRWLHPLAFRRSLGLRRRAMARGWRPTGGPV